MSVKISVKTFNNIVKVIAHIELISELLDEIGLDKNFYLHRVKQKGNMFHGELLKQIEQFWKGLDDENQKKYAKEVKGAKEIVNKLIYMVDQNSKQ
jgi:hypothetical protein